MMKQDVIDGVKIRFSQQLLAMLPNDLNSFEKKLESYTNEIIQRVAHYIHIETSKLPMQLKSVLIAMTCDMIKNNGDLDAKESVSALSLGDASIQFANSINDGIDNLVRAYKSDLHPYRCMAW